MTSFFRKNSLIGLAEILCRLPLILTVGYLAASVGPGVFGNWALILAFQAFIASIGGLGLSSSLSRLASVCDSATAKGYLHFAALLCMGVVVLAGICVILLRQPLGALLGVAPDLRDLLPISVLICAGAVGDGLLDAFFKAREAVKRQISFIFTRSLAEVVAVWLVFVAGWPIAGAPFQQLQAYILVLLCFKLLVYPWLLSGMDRSCWPSPESRQAFLHYGLPLVPSVVVIWFVGQGDRLVLSHFIEKHELGIYAFGASLAAYMVFLGYAVYPLLLPRASRLYEKGEFATIRDLFVDSQRLFLLILIAAMSILSLGAREAIAWTAGSGFAGAERVLVILGFAVCIEQLMGIYQYIFHLVRRTDWILWLNIIYAVVLFIVLSGVAYYYGAAYAPWAVLGVTVAFNVFRYFVAQRFMQIAILRNLPIVLIMVGVASIWVHSATLNWDFLSRFICMAVLSAGPGILIVRRLLFPR